MEARVRVFGEGKCDRFLVSTLESDRSSMGVDFLSMAGDIQTMARAYPSMARDTVYISVRRSHNSSNHK